MQTKNDRIKGTITLKSGVIVNFSDSNIIKGSISIDNQCVNRDDFHFGSVFSGMLTMGIVTNVDRYALFDAKIEITYELETSPNTYTPYKMGVFYISEANRIGSRINIKALDSMINLDVDVTEDTTGTVFELLTLVSEKTLIPLAQTVEQVEALVNGTELFSVRQERIGTYRDVISDLATVTCTFATINRDGLLELRPFQKVATKSIEKELRKATTSSDFETYYQAVKARFIADSNFYPYDAIVPNNQTGLVLDLGDISIVQGTPETKALIIQNIADELANVRYVPMSCDFFGNPELNLGDLVTYKKANGLVDNVSYVHFYKWQYRGVTKIKAGGSNPKMLFSKDKAYKQLASMEADVSLRDIIHYSYLNAKQYLISGAEEKEVINFQYVAVTNAKPVFLATIQFEMDADGIVDFAYYLNMMKDTERSVSQYFKAGIHFVTLYANFDVKTDERNEIGIRLSTRYHESYERIHKADYETLKLRFEALLASNVDNPYVEPTPIPIDTTVPTITIAKQNIHALLFAQGLNSNPNKWDGSFTITEEMPTFAIAGGTKYTFAPFRESVNHDIVLKRETIINQPIPTLVIQSPTVGYGFIQFNENVVASSIVKTSTIMVGKVVEYSSKYVDISTNKFKPQKAYSVPALEQPIDSGLMATISIDTAQFVRVDGIEVI